MQHLLHSQPFGVEIEDARWEVNLPGAAALVMRAYEDTVQAEHIRPVPGATIVLSDDTEVRALNRRFRGKDSATNVLSFPSAEGDVKTQLGIENYLGDIILAYDTVALEAERDGKSLSAHVTHLVVHATLHLLGYDHLQDDEAEKMETLEIRILSQFGITNPYTIL